MNQTLLFLLPNSIKKQVYFVLATLLVILSLPMAVVFSLGNDTLQILSSFAGPSESAGLYQGTTDATNTYEWGNCTYWVFHLRFEANNAIPNTWGNANTWATRALLGGYEVDQTPQVGSIMQTTRGKWGHVAYVTAVDANGGWTVSEMNVKGLDIVSTSSYPARAAQQYSFIHNKVEGNGLRLAP